MTDHNYPHLEGRRRPDGALELVGEDGTVKSVVMPCSDDLSICVCGQCPDTRAMLCDTCGKALAGDWPYDECGDCMIKREAQEQAAADEADQRAAAWWDEHIGELRRDARGRFTGGRLWPI